MRLCPPQSQSRAFLLPVRIFRVSRWQGLKLCCVSALALFGLAPFGLHQWAVMPDTVPRALGVFGEEERQQRVAILVLGGEPERDIFAVEMVVGHRRENETLQHSLLPKSAKHFDELVFVSSPGGGAEARLQPLADLGVLRLSWDAVDTVTNFSTVLPALRAAGIQHVRVVTSEYHMRRALAIASWILGSANIGFEPCPVPNPDRRPPEASWKVYRDTLRAIFWRLTGWDMSWLANMIIRSRTRNHFLA